MMQQNKDQQNTHKKGNVGRILGIVIPLLIFLLGLGLLLYPTFSDWWNQQHQSRAIATYQDAIDNNDDETIDAMLAAAEAYNESVLADRSSGAMTINRLTDEQKEAYNALLDITGTGIMGYVKIPKIDVELPIYHGTDEAVLQIAVGHIEGTSLPVGGKGTHAAISGHRGLPSAKLFTDIDSLGEGDVFIITCLNRKITYQVDQITTVLPEELSDLEIDPEQDYCTLVTCTPYGINSHRLLVRGHRIDNLIDEDIETIQIDIPDRELSDQERLQQMLPYILILAAGFFCLALIIPSKRKKEEPQDKDARSKWERLHAEREERMRERRKNYVPKDDYHDDDETFQPYGYEPPEADKDKRPDLKQPIESDEIEFYDADDDVFGQKGDKKAGKAEEPKVEEPKTEEPKAEEPKTEEPKVEEPKTEEPKAEEPKTEEPKVEEPKTEEPKTEEPKAEEPKAEEPKAEEPKAEEPKTEEPKAEEPKAEGPETEERKIEEQTNVENKNDET